MFTVRIVRVLICLLLLWGAAVAALTPGERVENFKLLDHSGRAHELYQLADKKAVVLMVQGNGCPADRRALSTYRHLRDHYRDKGVAFLMLNSNLQDNRERIAREAAVLDNTFPILVDAAQLIGESLGLGRTTEVFIIDPKGWTLKYRGSLDNRLGYETGEQGAIHGYAAEALNAVLRGRSVEPARTEPTGCMVSLRRPVRDPISYARDVAPILIENCVSCHRPETLGTFAMNRYNTVRGFAPAIRTMVRTQRMPPRHGNFFAAESAGDGALSVEERRTLVHWIEAGAPRGKGADPLLTINPDGPRWAYRQSPLPSAELSVTGLANYE